MSPLISVRRVFCVVLLAACGCGGRNDSDSAIRAVVHLGELKASCLRLAVRSGGEEKVSEAFPRPNDTSVTIGIYRGKLEKQVTLIARGYLGAADCQGTLTVNEESEPVVAEFSRSEVLEYHLALESAPFDNDRDGYRSALAGGPDCDDAKAKVHPGAKEDCADGLDDDCNGLTDCEDPICVQRACATGTCDNHVCVNGPVELDCHNGIDDDADGLVDCADPNCEDRTCAQSTCVEGVCQGGACVGSTPKVCDSPPSECFIAAGGCTPEQGGCLYTAHPGGSCNAENGACAGDGQCAPLFAYTPTNFTVPKYSEFSEPVVLDCNTTSVYDTSPNAPNAGFRAWCANAVKPTRTEITLPVSGQKAVRLAMHGLTVKSPLRMVGTLPVVLVVHGNAQLLDSVDLSSGGVLVNGLVQESGAGAGSPGFCAGATAGGGAMGGNNLTTGSGGGGAGYATAGGTGGSGFGLGASGGTAGKAETRAVGSPLHGGCPGGSGGGTGGGAGGRGGGALQLSVSGTLTIGAGVKVSASAGGGEGGGSGGNGGGGGGSGGALLFEAYDVAVGGVLTANGGGGASGGDADTAGRTGGSGSVSDAQPAPGGATGMGLNGGEGGSGASGLIAAPTDGAEGSGLNSGGGGGGGAQGKIKLRVATSCSGKLAGAVFSPSADSCSP